MPDWREWDSFGWSNDTLSTDREPRNLWERADQIMRLLDSNASSPGSSSHEYGQDLFAPGTGDPTGSSGRVQTVDLGGSIPGVKIGADERTIQITAAAGTIVLGIGQIGIAALRALGAAAAATLAAILESYKNRLGRLPSPGELNDALSEQGGILSRTRPRPKRNREEECRNLNDADVAFCRDFAKKYGPKEGSLCYQSATARYGQCIAKGIDKVTIPLYGDW